MTEENEFAKEARSGKNDNIVRELWGFMSDNKKWWLAPILLSMLAVGALAVFGGSGAAPFVYTLF